MSHAIDLDNIVEGYGENYGDTLDLDHLDDLNSLEDGLDTLDALNNLDVQLPQEQAQEPWQEDGLSPAQPTPIIKFPDTTYSQYIPSFSATGNDDLELDGIFNNESHSIGFADPVINVVAPQETESSQGSQQKFPMYSATGQPLYNREILDDTDKSKLESPEAMALNMNMNMNMNMNSNGMFIPGMENMNNMNNTSGMGSNVGSPYESRFAIAPSSPNLRLSVSPVHTPLGSPSGSQFDLLSPHDGSQSPLISENESFQELYDRRPRRALSDSWSAREKESFIRGLDMQNQTQNSSLSPNNNQGQNNSQGPSQNDIYSAAPINIHPAAPNLRVGPTMMQANHAIGIPMSPISPVSSQSPVSPEPGNQYDAAQTYTYDSNLINDFASELDMVPQVSHSPQVAQLSQLPQVQFPQTQSSHQGLSPNVNTLNPPEQRSRARSATPSTGLHSPRMVSPATSPQPQSSQGLLSVNPTRTRSLSSPGESPNDLKAAQSFSCHLCNRKFTRTYNLRSHMRTHTDERPFACRNCGKAFARQHDRKRHEALHSGEKNFACSNSQPLFQWGCGKRFARADALGRHFRTEAGRSCLQPLAERVIMNGANEATAPEGIVCYGFDDNNIPNLHLIQIPNNNQTAQNKEMGEREDITRRTAIMTAIADKYKAVRKS